MDFSNPHLAAPAWLWFACVAPAAFALLCAYAARARTRQLNAVADPQSQPHLLHSHSTPRRVFKQILVALALALIGIALARPQWGQETQTTNLEGEDIMIALDCSKSMLATDVRPNRLERSKLAIIDFIQARPGGRVGLVAFSGQAFVQCPLTFDYDAFRECLTAVDDKAIPVQGTDIARALDEASQAMEKDARRKLLILVTDGEDLEHGGVRKAAELAKSNVIVYAVGVGSSEGQLLQINGQQIGDSKGQPVRSRLDENTLRAIATATGGAYQPLGSLGQGLTRMHEKIQLAAGGPGAPVIHPVGIERFHLFLAAALGLLVMESLVGTRRRMSENSST